MSSLINALPLAPQVDVMYTGAKLNHTWPVNCTESAVSLDGNGTGLATYSCQYTNSSQIKPVNVTAFGLISGVPARLQEKLSRCALGGDVGRIHS